MLANRHHRRFSFQPLESRQLMAADGFEYSPIELSNEAPAIVFDPIASESTQPSETRPSINATFSAVRVDEAATVHLIVSRDATNLAQPLVVRVAGGDPTQLAMPKTITIPSGQSQAIIRLNPIDDSDAERTMALEYTFSATGHRPAMATIELLDDESPKFQNPNVAFDVNNDGKVSATDALSIINIMSNQNDPALDPSSDSAHGLFHDVNGDYRITAVDALQVINELNRRTTNSQPRSVIAAVEQLYRDDSIEIHDSQTPPERALF